MVWMIRPLPKTSYKRCWKVCVCFKSICRIYSVQTTIGMNAPTKIPVNIYIPTPPVDDDQLFGTADIDIGMGLPQHTDHPTTKIVLRAPEPPPGFGMFEIAVEYSSLRPRGVVLKIEGALSADIDIDMAEEVCRRGGLLGLPGRVWAKLHGRT